MPPYKSLGSHLRYLREHSSETLAEVSGAVEINADNLERIEQGVERPSEDVLMLLISHFNMAEHEALRLWELAGYDLNDRPDYLDFTNLQGGASSRPMLMLLAVDVRTQYTDGIEVVLNKAGAVLNFTQAGGNDKRLPVARVGMSLQQLEAVSQTIQKAILQARYHRPKGLPAPKTSTSKPKSARRIQRRAAPRNSRTRRNDSSQAK